MADISEDDAGVRTPTEGQTERDASFVGTALTLNHDFRTSLMSVASALRILARMDLPPMQRRLVETADRGALQLEVWIDNVSRLAGLSGSGSSGPAQRPLNVASELHAVANALHLTAVERGTPLMLDVDPDVAALRLGDAKLMRQTLLNLLDCVIKLVSAGDITVTARCAGGDLVVVTVSGHNAALTNDDRAYLGAILTNAHQTTPERDGGTALGLSIAHNLAQLMGGDLTLRNDCAASGLMLELTMFAPRAVGHAGATNDEPIQSAQSILVVEDNTINQKLIRDILTSLGHRATLASTGAEALSAVEDDSFDLIFMDLHLPDIDGYTVAETIRARADDAAKTPIFALTAETGADVEQRVLDAGMVKMITKPIIIDELAQIIAQRPT